MRRTIAVAVLSASLASSATIVGTSGSSFATYKWTGQTGKVNNNGTPYFDSLSAQGNTCNMAFYITGQSANTSCSAAMQPGNVDRIGANYQGPASEANFWRGANNSTPDANAYVSAKETNFVIYLMAEGSSNNAQNSFGAYYVDPLTNQIVTLLLFDGPAGPGSAVRFTAGDYDFGFYIDDGTRTYYTQSMYNRLNATGTGIDTTTSHFALFRDPKDSSNNSNTTSWDRLWIGASGGTESTRDFNDIIAFIAVDTTLPPSSVPQVYAPEPSTFALAAGGTILVLMSLLRRGRPRK